MLTDPIADMLTRIRNGYAASKIEVSVPHSNVCEAVAKVLQRNKFLGEVRVKEKDKKKNLECFLLYQNGKPAIEHIKTVSKPGCRVYQKASGLKSVLGGYGISIVTTNKGVMTGKEAKKKNLGGEVIAEVW